MTVRVFPIRHLGPGSARALGASLDSWGPDTVLIEGPSEAEPILHLAADPAMQPPVALLAYLSQRPAVGAFYPMASFSPEWVAIRHALRRAVPVTMIDLPAGVFLHNSMRDDRPYRGDPLATLAEAAGYDDAERWWEDVVEHRTGEEPWEAITEAMGALRDGQPPESETEAKREASMRKHIRAAERRFERIAVVCGAWHAPVLVERGPARADNALLSGLPRQRAAVTWVPWTNTRLGFASGYGAGVASPGWYGHLFESGDRPVERWMARVAGLLRAEQLDAPPSSVVDAVRLADALAALRSRPLAGLAECNDAARAVLAGGADGPLQLIRRRLVVGEAVGQVPEHTPTVPLASDLAAEQRRLRLKPADGARALELDLRKETDRGRSLLLYRLGILDVPWGTVTASGRGTGTYREEWALHWQPELSVRVVEASVYGSTVEAAATAKAIELAQGATDIAAVADVVDRCLLAALPAAVPSAMRALDTQAAQSSDVGQLMMALSRLARMLRYGSVRQSGGPALQRIVEGLTTRVCIGIGPAAASLDDDAALTMSSRVEAVTDALASLDEAELRRRWLDAVALLSARPGLHGRLAGRATRIVSDAGLVGADEVRRRLSAALSAGEEPRHGAAWIEGLLSGSGLLLVHDPELLSVVDGWVTAVGADAFDEVLPLLRRTFALFEPGERILIGEATTDFSGGSAGRPAPRDGRPVDAERAEAVLPLVARLLGIPPAGGRPS